MASIKIKFEITENNFNRKILWLMHNISVFYSITLSYWEKRKKKKKPRILNVRLVKLWFILFLFILAAFPFLLFLPESGKWEILAPSLIIIIFIFAAIVLLFTIIFAIVYLLNFLYKLAASLTEAIVLTIWYFKHPLKKGNKNLP